LLAVEALVGMIASRRAGFDGHEMGKRTALPWTGYLVTELWVLRSEERRRLSAVAAPSMARPRFSNVRATMPDVLILLGGARADSC
jgi:hypothetical protein